MALYRPAARPHAISMAALIRIWKNTWRTDPHFLWTEAMKQTILTSILILPLLCLSSLPLHSADFVTWKTGHPELAVIFGEPFSKAGQRHRQKTFIPWTATKHKSHLPAIQPSVVRGKNNELFASCFSPKSWEMGMVAHSKDGGKTWATIGTPVDFRFRIPKGRKRLHVSGNGIGVTKKGTLLYHFSVQYNDGRKPAGGYADPSYRVDTYVARSTNRGKTWTSVKINANERELVGGQRCRIAQLPDGRMIFVLAAWSAPREGKTIPMSERYARTYLYTSADDGKTWDRGAKPICNHGWEPDLLPLPSGRLLLAIRYQRHKLPGDPKGLVSPHRMRDDKPPYKKSKQIGSGLVARFTAILHSDDAGKTWTQPRLVTGFDEQTGTLIRLSDGTILLPFGYKTDTRGQRFIVSYDRGETWSRSVFQLHADGQYASSVVLKGDKIVTVIHGTKGLSLQSLRWQAPTKAIVKKKGFWRPRVAEPLGMPVQLSFRELKLNRKKKQPFKRSQVSPHIEKLHGKRVALTGYIHPQTVFKNKGIRRFVLIDSNMYCSFGLEMGLGNVAVVHMAKGKGAVFSTRPVTVTGTFRVKPLLDPSTKRTLVVYRLDDATVKPYVKPTGR